MDMDETREDLECVLYEEQPEVAIWKKMYFSTLKIVDSLAVDLKEETLFKRIKWFMNGKYQA